MEGAEDRQGTRACRKFEEALWSITALTSEAAYSLWAHQVRRAPHLLSRWDRAAPRDIAKGPSVRVHHVDLVINAIPISLRKAVKCGPHAPMWFKARGIKRLSEDVDKGMRDLLSAAIFRFSADFQSPPVRSTAVEISTSNLGIITVLVRTDQ